MASKEKERKKYREISKGGMYMKVDRRDSGIAGCGVGGVGPMNLLYRLVKTHIKHCKRFGAKGTTRLQCLNSVAISISMAVADQRL